MTTLRNQSLGSAKERICLGRDALFQLKCTWTRRWTLNFTEIPCSDNHDKGSRSPRNSHNSKDKSDIQPNHRCHSKENPQWNCATIKGSNISHWTWFDDQNHHLQMISWSIRIQSWLVHFPFGQRKFMSFPAEESIGKRWDRLLQSRDGLFARCELDIWECIGGSLDEVKKVLDLGKVHFLHFSEKRHLFIYTCISRDLDESSQSIMSQFIGSIMGCTILRLTDALDMYRSDRRLYLTFGILISQRNIKIYITFLSFRKTWMPVNPDVKCALIRKVTERTERFIVVLLIHRYICMT
jgi:hypothetical protein